MYKELLQWCSSNAAPVSEIDMFCCGYTPKSDDVRENELAAVVMTTRQMLLNLTNINYPVLYVEQSVSAIWNGQHIICVGCCDADLSWHIVCVVITNLCSGVYDYVYTTLLDSMRSLLSCDIVSMLV